MRVGTLLTMATLVTATSLGSVRAGAQDAGPAADPSADKLDADLIDADLPDAAAVSASDAGPASAPTPVPVAPPPPPPDEEVDDREPPFVEDLAVAASNPEAAPLITAIITDDTRVERASIFFRRRGEARFTELPLVEGEGGMFIARLPDGAQHAGFDYYVSVTDGANRGGLGSEDEPFEVNPATEGTLERLERERRLREQPAIHPGWVMVSLGAGLLAAAGSGAFFYDLSVLQQEIAEIDDRISQTDEPAQLAALRDAREQRETASAGDLIFGGVLGVIALAGLATGVGLLVAVGVEE